MITEKFSEFLKVITNKVDKNRNMKTCHIFYKTHSLNFRKIKS